ncbi:MAG TPA: sensory rhodopsin transducer [Clostridia bacterium]|jgi:hypothetical protein|nr:hypothetical protein [Clostridiaceae bacterium]HOA31196.1 sensory rhodopsin transducer [Clostridia bacterium]HPZ52057.1 sensory rhodopsin transducer [Clostridia bacterium]
MSNEAYGKRIWLIPDGYYPEVSKGDVYVSHEAVCVLNVGNEDANIDITLYFEDREPMTGFKAVCKAQRTNHIRMDKIVSVNGEKVPRGVPYAMMVVSDVPVVVQYSRLDASQAEMGFMGLIAY